MGSALKITAHLSSPLAGDDAPHIDSLLVFLASRRCGKDTVPGYKVDRKFSCPDTSDIAIPILRERVSVEFRGRQIDCSLARTSSPILSPHAGEWFEHIAKRLGVEHSGIISPEERRVVTTTNNWTKSYRLPLRVRRIDKIVWYAVGTRRKVLEMVQDVSSLGKKISVGYGLVSKWEVENLGDVPHRWWPLWWHSDAGSVLMRPVPQRWSDLPSDLIGAKSFFGACSDPYWHQDRYQDILIPC